MAKVLRTTNNPYGLSVKQRLVLDDIVHSIVEGHPINPTESHMRFYNVQKRSTAAVMAHENLSRPNFRKALYSMLEEKGVWGVSGKVEGVLLSGLNAQRVLANGETIPDFRTRLRYIQEINRLAGLY
jgi:hypothetical protein